MGEQQLVIRAIKGEDEAFLALMNDHKIKLYKIAFAYLRDQNEALEAIQEVTCRAYSSVHSLREPSYFSTWLTKIMMNYCNDQLKKKKRYLLKEDLSSNGLADQANHTRMELLDAMEGLDPKERDLLTLKYFQELKIKEIAVLMKCPEGTVKTWLNKALKSLKSKLEEKGETHGA